MDWQRIWRGIKHILGFVIVGLLFIGAFYMDVFYPNWRGIIFIISGLIFIAVMAISQN